MKLALAILFQIGLAILQVHSGDLSHLTQKQRLDIAKQFASELNTNVFKSRHKNFPVGGLNAKARKVFSTESNKDTVAVRIDRNGEVYVASNTKTRTTPFNKNTQSFNTKDFGLSESDRAIIFRTLQQNPTLRNQRLHIVELNKRPTDAVSNAQDHAEMKLLTDRQSNPPGRGGRRKSVVAASKPVCTYCSAQLGSGIPHNHKGGLKTVKNWHQPVDVNTIAGGVGRKTYTPLIQHPSNKLIAYPGYNHPSRNPGSRNPSPQRNIPSPSRSRGQSPVRRTGSGSARRDTGAGSSRRESFSYEWDE